MKIENGWIYQYELFRCCDELQERWVCESCEEEAGCAFCDRLISAPDEPCDCGA